VSEPFRQDIFRHEFKQTGGARPGLHCTYCPLSQGETCQLGCATMYAKLEAERTKDGVKVIDHA
jgi:hypothetical protein